MRKTFYLWSAIALAVSLVLPQLAKTKAAEDLPIASAAPERRGPQGPTAFGLPNFDIRSESQERFDIRAVADDPVVKTRLDAIEAFREELDPSVRGQLKVELNISKVPKTFFNYAAPLSEVNSEAPDDIARDFLSSHSEIFGLNAREIKKLRLESEDNDRGTTFLNYEQTVAGITVFHGHVQVAVNPSGQVFSVNEGYLIPGVSIKTKHKIGEEEALRIAFDQAGSEMPAGTLNVLKERESKGGARTIANPLGKGYEDIISELRVMEVDEEPVLTWHAFIDIGPSQWYEMSIDADTGELLFRSNLYSDVAQGTVFTINPLGARSIQSFVGDATINTAAGWLGPSTVSTGNNVDAYLDTDRNNQPDPINTPGLVNGHSSAANQDFTFPFALNVDPRTEQPAAVSNLFYFCNIMHDFVYNLGFTEAAGNFQTDNFGRGGAGNDPVNAEAQDGSGTNNANFSTPPDGQRPRMQMFLFTLGTTALNDDRDGDLDGDVILHEYGHGVSNRLVGGPANTSCLGGTQAGAMGEGWSDYWAITFFNDGRVGEYVANNEVNGIRRAAYTVPANPVHDSYADLGVGGFEVHRDGEVWAATLWDLRTQLGAAVADRLVLQGMKFTPCSPSMLNARDGILQADQNINAGANRCAIWTVFARHGMGNSAVGNNGTTHTAATDLPTDCGPSTGTGPVFFDDFETDRGWAVNPNGTDTATTGIWERGIPQATNSNGVKQLATTISGVNDLVTGRLAGASAGANDIDGGTTSIRSPLIALPASGNLTLSFNFYLAHGSNATSADFLRVSIVSGTTTTQVFQRLGQAADIDAAWTSTSVSLNAFAGQSVRILIQAADAATGSLVEAAIDDVRITAQ